MDFHGFGGSPLGLQSALGRSGVTMLMFCLIADIRTVMILRLGDLHGFGESPGLWSAPGHDVILSGVEFK